MKDKVRSYALIAVLLLAFPLLAFYLAKAGLYRVDKSFLFDRLERTNGSKTAGGTLNLLFVGTSQLLPVSGEKTFADLAGEKLQGLTKKKVNVFVRAASNLASSTVAADIDDWILETNANAVVLLLGNGDFFNSFKYAGGEWGRLRSFLEETGFVRRVRETLLRLRHREIRQKIMDVGLSRMKALEDGISGPEGRERTRRRLELVRLYDDFEMKDKARSLLRSVRVQATAPPEILREAAFYFSEYDLFSQAKEALRFLKAGRGPKGKDIDLLVSNLSKHSGRENKLERTIRFDDPDFFPALSFNYEETIRKIQARGRVPIPLQFPGRPVGSLKRILHDFPALKVVDNEAAFRRAVLSTGYDAVYRDHDILEFGHLTRLGHQLMADDLVTFIRQEYPELL